MIAFVLSGGGSRGAFEVGALRALLAHGVQPDMLVGSSAGAVNATGLALDPTMDGVRRLEALWLGMQQEAFYSRNPLLSAMRLILRKPSLYSSQRMHRLVRAELWHQARSFADVQGVRLFLTGVDLENGELHIFGDDPTESVVDGVMASTAIQPYFPPWRYRNRDYADGSLISNLPLLAALNRGATEVYALDVTVSSSGAAEERDLLSLLRNEAYLVIDKMRQHELRQARNRLGNRLHHIHYTRFAGMMPFDFTHTEEMIADGEAMLNAYLRRLARDNRPRLGWLQQWRNQRAVDYQKQTG